MRSAGPWTFRVVKLMRRGYPGLKLVVEIRDGLGRGDAAHATVARGLRSLYAK